MKPTALVVILMLSLFLVPTAFALMQLIQPVETTLFSHVLSGVHFNFLASGAVIVPDDPGSGGGGQGVIRK
jgi:hypothetical protein